MLMVDVALLRKNSYVALTLLAFIHWNKKCIAAAHKDDEKTNHPFMESHALLRATVRTLARPGQLSELQPFFRILQLALLKFTIVNDRLYWHFVHDEGRFGQLNFGLPSSLFDSRKYGLILESPFLFGKIKFQFEFFRIENKDSSYIT